MKWALACLATLFSTTVIGQNYPYPVDEHDKIPPAELKARRETVKTYLGAGNAGILFTNPIRNRNNDVDFRFRGDSNFLYLTGFEEPDAALILVPSGVVIDGRRTTEILFVNEPNLQSITWLGYRMGPAFAESLLGIQMALPNRRFEEVCQTVLRSATKLSLARMPDANVGMLNQMATSLMAARSAMQPGSGASLDSKLRDMRGVKSKEEIRLIRKAAEISARAHVEVMKAIRPGMREYEVSSLAEFGFGKEGCEYVGYPSICGSGPNSTILHYIANRRAMVAGEVYLMDAAGEYHGYTADVTRTFPVSGKFSPAQKQIYQIVYDAQDLGIAMCRDGESVAKIGQAISARLSDGLIKLGIIKSASELSRYYMHGFGHGLGLDVHDPMPGVLVPGVVLTVEPGIYIKEGSPCDKKYWNIGIRIEDDILVTEKVPVNLSAGAPRTIEGIEKLMAK